MRITLAMLAIVALVVLASCSGEETDTPASTPDGGPAMKAPDTPKEAPKDITYECGCGKTKTQGAHVEPPS